MLSAQSLLTFYIFLLEVVDKVLQFLIYVVQCCHISKSKVRTNEKCWSYEGEIDRTQKKKYLLTLKINYIQTKPLKNIKVVLNKCVFILPNTYSGLEFDSVYLKY